MSSTPTPSHAVAVGDAAAPRGDIARLLGPGAAATPVAQAAAASRFQLSGVLAPKEGFAESHGVALIAVDGRPARAYQVGARVADDWILQGVTRRTASVGPRQAGAAVVLELAERPAPATGSLPATNGVESSIAPAFGSAAGGGSQSQTVQPAQMQQPPPPQFQPQPQAVPEQVPTSPDSSSGDNSAGPRRGGGPPRRAGDESR